MNFLKISAGALLFTMVAFPAVANDETSDPKENKLKVEWTPVPTVKSRNGKFQVKLRTRFYLDNAWINSSDNSIDLNGTKIRSARIGIDGKYGEKFSFRIEFDLARDVKAYKDIYFQWKSWATIKVGHHKIGTPMEGSSSSRFIPLMERSAMINGFGFGRKGGVSLTKNFGNSMIQIGVGGGDVDFTKVSSPGFQISARGTHAIPIERGYIHFGASLSRVETTDIETNFLYAARPFQHQAPALINTGRIAESQIFIGFEAGIFKGPFSLVNETGFLKATLVAPAQGQADPTFWGSQVTASYFLTGEDSPYNPKNGTYARPNIKRPFLKGGPGAIQIVARYDYIDLTDNGIFGGIQKTVILGVNWWLASQIKVAVNYSHSNVSQAFLVADNGSDGANKVDAFGIRTQIDW